MDDMISRQAAIDALNKMKIYRPLDSDRYVISDCLNKIVNLPSAQPGWIPCSTALPKQDGDYLVTKKSFGWNCTEYTETDIARYEKKDGWHKADTVLAWCELPTPYREWGQDG